MKTTVLLKTAVVITTCLLLSLSPLTAQENRYVDAWFLYERGKALLEDPGSPLIQFNVGNVLYKKKNYEKALEGYSKSLDTDDPILQSQTYYNM